MKPLIRISASLLFLGTSSLLTSCDQKSGEAAPRPGNQSSVITVNGIIVQPEPLDNVVRSTGTVLASESVDLVAEVAGRVEAIPFKEGAHVSKGNLLVKINDDDLQAQLKKTELQIQLTAEQEARQKQLYDVGGISKEQYDIALNQLNS